MQTRLEVDIQDQLAAQLPYRRAYPQVNRKLDGTMQQQVGSPVAVEAGPSPVRPPGILGLHELSVQSDGDVVAHQNSASLESCIPGQTEVLAIDPGAG